MNRQILSARFFEGDIHFSCSRDARCVRSTASNTKANLPGNKTSAHSCSTKAGHPNTLDTSKNHCNPKTYPIFKTHGTQFALDQRCIG